VQTIGIQRNARDLALPCRRFSSYWSIQEAPASHTGFVQGQQRMLLLSGICSFIHGSSEQTTPVSDTVIRRSLSSPPVAHCLGCQMHKYYLR